MSFLIIELTSKGLIFGADKNVTTTHPDGTREQKKKTEKVLKWPNDKALVGFVGQGRIGSISTRDWIDNFILRNLEFTSLNEISEKLKDEIEEQRIIDEGTNPPKGLIIHLGGFETISNIITPKIYLITNVWALTKEEGYTDCRKEFKVSEELWNYFPNTVSPLDLRNKIIALENNLEPFWFHQGFDLMTFNALHASLKLAFRNLVHGHPKHKLPSNLREWEKHARLQILMYGAYFEAFHDTNELYVGGGSDILSIEWK